MKATWQERATEGSELERFCKTADRLVRSARKDKTVALELLRATGYFDVMAKSSSGPKTKTKKAKRK